MKLIPILFSTPMVPPIITDYKTNTRRLNGLHEINEDSDIYEYRGQLKEAPDVHSFARMWRGMWVETKYIKCPYGQPGDVLWVREKFCNINKPDIDPEFVYFTETIDAEDYDPKEWKWKPNIHMPFAACRIFLRVKEIRVERLNEITEDDALREGVDNWTFKDCATPQNFMDYSDKYGPPLLCATDSFETLWISINGSDSWNSNPWVWVIAFERITDENEIAEIKKQWNERRAK